MEIPQKSQVAGVVLHQPLNLRIFLDFGKKRQNLNGIPVSPGPKTQNAPTWQVENTAGRSVLFRFPGGFRTPIPTRHVTFCNADQVSCIGYRPIYIFIILFTTH